MQNILVTTKGVQEKFEGQTERHVHLLSRTRASMASVLRISRA